MATAATGTSGPTILEDVKKRSDQACDAATEFVKLFYVAMDKKRHTLEKLYLEAATLLWNGNEVIGRDSIVKYLAGLPVSEHRVEALDSQPISHTVTHGQTTILVVASGLVKCQGHVVQNFYQNFMLTAENNTWKIATDCFRSSK